MKNKSLLFLCLGLIALMVVAALLYNSLGQDYLPEQWVVANDGIVYAVPEDSYLVLGDNRNHSMDARFWPEEALRTGVATTEEEALSYSFVNRKQILGKAIFKYYPHIKKLS